MAISKKAPVAKKPVAKTPVVKAATLPTVTVETKKILTSDCCKTDAASSACCPSSKKMCCGKVVFAALTIINTILLGTILTNQNSAEVSKVGGKDNYKLVQDLQKTEGYKTWQKQQIEQAMQMFEKGQTAPEANTQQQAPAAANTQAPAQQQQAQRVQQAPAAR